MDFTAIIKTVAPWIGTALVGPLGGMAVEAATAALGLSDNSVASLKTAVSGASSEQMLALKNADQEFAVKIQALGFSNIEKLEAIASEDRKDARAMQMATRSRIPAVLSVVVTVGYFTVLVGMMMGYFKVSDSQALMLMLGSLSTAWGVVMAFWIGTTSDSGRKTELLAKAQPIQ